MATVTIHAAKTTLSQLLVRAESGEEIVLARGNTPVAKLVPLQAARSKRKFGALEGKISVGPAFFEPMDENELAAWE